MRKSGIPNQNYARFENFQNYGLHEYFCLSVGEHIYRIAWVDLGCTSAKGGSNAISNPTEAHSSIGKCRQVSGDKSETV